MDRKSGKTAWKDNAVVGWFGGVGGPRIVLTVFKFFVNWENR